MQKILWLLFFFSIFLSPPPTHAATPVGYLDAANDQFIAGWARDDDYSGPIQVQIYVDGKLSQTMLANGNRPDVGAHAYHWNHSGFGYGTHSIEVKAIGVDATGNPDGEIFTLVNSPATLDNGPAPPTPTPTPTPTPSSGIVEGYLDSANGQFAAGWVKDKDYDGPVKVQIFIDDVLVHKMLANSNRSDVGDHAYHWNHAPYGWGDHKVSVFFEDADAGGSPTGQLIELSGSPRTFNTGCSGLPLIETQWCDGVHNYWVSRQKDTTLLINDFVKIGVNNSYGGMITQLYRPDRPQNLIQEHGGAVMQLSIWGYDLSGPQSGKPGRWYGNDVNIGRCDDTLYSSESECLSAGNSKCIQRGAADGAHVTSCQQKTCNNWDVGAPWNPLPSQGYQCAWDSPTNDVDLGQSCGPNCWETRKDKPGNFTKSDNGLSGVSLYQKVQLADAYAKIDYSVDIAPDFAFVTGSHDQEIPAIFTNNVFHKFYYYGGNSPYTDPDSAVTELGQEGGGQQTFSRQINFAGRGPFPSHMQNPFDVATEHWWGVCDNSETNCLTLASFSPTVLSTSLSRTGGNAGYLTPLGYFGMKPGDSHKATLYVFPYKYNQVVSGKSIRQRIFDLSSAAAPTPADLNSDGTVNQADFDLFVSYYPTQNPIIDFNADSLVNIFDYNILVEHFGK